MASGQFVAAYNMWVDLLDFIDSRSGSIKMENFKLGITMSSVSLDSVARLLLSPGHSQLAQNGSNMVNDSINRFLKQKFKIIPLCSWQQEVFVQIFDDLANDFMKLAIIEERKQIIDS
ncbi:hypothetical protein PVAP13_4NG195822, partial [Panicum virgatum]